MYYRFAVLSSCVFLLGVTASSCQALPSDTGSAVSPTQAQATLDFHNSKRHDAGSPPLQWSSQLAGVAQIWANQLAAQGCVLKHSNDPRYGENLFSGSGNGYTALDATQHWYSEIKQYQYAPLSLTNFQAVGHYTQMVWSSSTSVGIGQSRCSDGTIVIVAEYSPRGNILGERPY